ncbi:MAG: hypothetical protein J6W04_00105 [Bacteroidales bacterium]|nr:hypothetical protein [Bacteroidales bacterium]
MRVTYEIFKRYRANKSSSLYGIRYELVQDYKSLSLTLNWSKRSRFSIKGESVGRCPVDLGDYIVIFRNSKFLYGGVVQDVQAECHNVETEVFSWEASGDDDSIIFDWRIILTDNGSSKNMANLTFDSETYDKSDGYAYNRILHYIEQCFGTPTMSARRITGLVFPTAAQINAIPAAKRGKNESSAYRLKKLSDALKEIGEEDNLFAKYEWNPTTNDRRITIPLLRDRTTTYTDESGKKYDPIIISPQFGNIASWSVSKSFPKFNAIWVCSGDYTTEQDGETYKNRIWVYAEDADSIAKYGRIESVVTKSEISVKKDDPETEENEKLTKAQATRMLQDEARKALEENAAKEKYTIKLAQIEDMKFMEDWMVGDKVKAIIGKKEDGTPNVMYPIIETVSITFTGNEEKLTPTVGETEEGLFSDVFKMISGIDKRLQSEETK